MNPITKSVTERGAWNVLLAYYQTLEQMKEGS
jgi:hypothetical protein